MNGQYKLNKSLKAWYINQNLTKLENGQDDEDMRINIYAEDHRQTISFKVYFYFLCGSRKYSINI